jgi:hypothetical protein
LSRAVNGEGQGCQMAYFQSKNSNLGKFLSALLWKKLVYFVAIWSILRDLVYFMANEYILWLYGIFFPFWYVVTTKIWQSWCSATRLGEIRPLGKK